MKYLAWLIVPLACTFIIPNFNVWYSILVVILACGASILQVCCDDYKTEIKELQESNKEFDSKLAFKNLELEMLTAEKKATQDTLDAMYMKVSARNDFINNPMYIAFAYWYKRCPIQEVLATNLGLSRYQVKKRAEEINKLLGFEYIVWKNNGLSKKD